MGVMRLPAHVGFLQKKKRERKKVDFTRVWLLKGYKGGGVPPAFGVLVGYLSNRHSEKGVTNYTSFEIELFEPVESRV